MLACCMKPHQNHVALNRRPNHSYTLDDFPTIPISSNLNFAQKQPIKTPKQEEHKENEVKKVPRPKDHHFKSGPNFSLIPLCCRTYFFELERILPAEDKKIEYKSYRLPFSPASIQTLKKTVCAFLNSIGGQMYIGVKETTNKKYRYILGNYLTENDKEEVLKTFRKISECIYPHCTEGLEVEFIPIRKNPFPDLDLKQHSECYYYDFSRRPLDLRKCTYLPARYVIRVRVAPGNNESFYSYLQTEYQLNKNATSDEFIPFRSQNQVLVKEISQEILKKFKVKLLFEKDKPLAKIHEGPCLKPEMGNPRNEPEQFQHMIDVKKIEAVLHQHRSKFQQRRKSSSSRSNQSIHDDKASVSVQRKQQAEQIANCTTPAELKMILKHPLSYIALNITAQRLASCINKTPAKDYTVIEAFKNSFNEADILIITLNGYQRMEQFLRVIKSIESHFARQNVEFIGIAKSIKVEEHEIRRIMENLLQKREEHKHAMRKKVIEFYSLGVAASYLLYMRNLGYHLDAIQE